jgi:ankyrin repeat protein
MNIQQRIRTRIAGIALLAIIFAAPVFSSDELNQQLFQLVSYNEPAEISRLIKEGANPNHVVAGTPLLTIATVNSSLEAIKALLAGGADPNTRDEYGKTVLMYAAEIGEIDTVKTLLENKAEYTPTRGWIAISFDNAIPNFFLVGRKHNLF